MTKKQTDLLDKYLAPAGGITALKFTPQGLLVTFEKEIPEKFSIVTGVMEAMQLINDMLHETATRTRQEDIRVLESIKKGGECYRFDKDRYALKCTCNNCYHLNEAIQKLNSLNN